MLDNLSDSLQGSLEKLRGERKVDEETVKEIVKEIQRSLLQADVEVSIVQEMTDSIENRALNEEPPASTTAREHVLKIVYEEMVNIVGESADIPLEDQTIMLAGLQGSGKTTSASKIAWWLSKKGMKPAVIQTDTFRPGAYEQAKEMCERAEVDFYGDPDNDNPVDIAEKGIEKFEDADVKIVDTAGRHALEDDLIEEIKEIENAINPDRNLLVLDAAIGRGASEQAQEFQESIGVDGIVITKMDGTAKGGGALAAIRETNSGIGFIGTGEDVKDIERFEPEGFISRLLGMGDLKQLSERVERAMHEQEDDDWDPEDVFEGEFTMYDMKKQIEAMNSMGSLTEIFSMIPGMGGGLTDMIDEEELNMTQEKMREFEIIMDSFTNEEMLNPEIIDASRKERIAKGSGKKVEEVEMLLDHYTQTKNMMDQFGGADMEQLQKQMGGGKNPFDFGF